MAFFYLRYLALFLFKGRFSAFADVLCSKIRYIILCSSPLICALCPECHNEPWWDASVVVTPVNRSCQSCRIGRDTGSVSNVGPVRSHQLSHLASLSKRVLEYKPRVFEDSWTARFLSLSNTCFPDYPRSDDVSVSDFNV